MRTANDCLSSIEHSLVMPLIYEFYYHKIYNSSRHLYLKNLEQDKNTGEISNQKSRVWAVERFYKVTVRYQLKIYEKNIVIMRVVMHVQCIHLGYLDVIGKISQGLILMNLYCPLPSTG